MTQPTQEQTLELPVAEAPWGQQVVATSPFPEVPSPIIWAIGQVHPLTSDLTVVRIYVHPGVDVAVYSRHKDGRTGVRNLIPWHDVRLPVETMDPQTFVEEIGNEEEDREGEEESQESDEGPMIAQQQQGLQPMPPASNGG